MELPNIAAYAYQDVHVWSALLTCLRPPRGARGMPTQPHYTQEGGVRGSNSKLGWRNGL